MNATRPAENFPATKKTAPIMAEALDRIWREAHLKNCHPTIIVSILEVARKKAMGLRKKER